MGCSPGFVCLELPSLGEVRQRESDQDQDQDDEQPAIPEMSPPIRLGQGHRSIPEYPATVSRTTTGLIRFMPLSLFVRGALDIPPAR